MPYPRFLDVEASSLSSKSYPVEVAWSDAAGSIECHLINPYAEPSWTDWDYEAQQLHGISRKQCSDNGVTPRFLCRLMSQSIAPGEIIYADGGPIDRKPPSCPPVTNLLSLSSCDFLIRSGDGRYIEMASTY